MEEKERGAAVVPYIVYESSMARSERHIRRLYRGVLRKLKG